MSVVFSSVGILNTLLRSFLTDSNVKATLMTECLGLVGTADSWLMNTAAMLSHKIGSGVIRVKLSPGRVAIFLNSPVIHWE